MDLLKEFDASITVGIIGSMFSLADPDIVGYIQEKMSQQTDCFRFEIANHGYLHEDFTTIDATEQVGVRATFYLLFSVQSNYIDSGNYQRHFGSDCQYFHSSLQHF